jgi:peptidoglycan/xylan/chitin deacetylase (PgdA/CDA1 family)
MGVLGVVGAVGARRSTTVALRALFAVCALCALPAGTARAADSKPVELHSHLSPAHAVALTLDACSGAYDRRLIDLLVQLRVPATLFVTKRWLDRNAQAVAELQQHPELFEFENHGTQHVPAVVGPASQRLYGMRVEPDDDALRAEITGGAEAIKALTGRAPRFFRGAGAAYDSAGVHMVQALGYRIAGFSVNADGGARYPAPLVAARLLAVKPGDVVIAHMNHPASGTAEGFARALPPLLQRGVVFVKLSQGMLAAP